MDSEPIKGFLRSRTSFGLGSVDWCKQISKHRIHCPRPVFSGENAKLFGYCSDAKRAYSEEGLEQERAAIGSNPKKEKNRSADIGIDS